MANDDEELGYSMPPGGKEDKSKGISYITSDVDVSNMSNDEVVALIDQKTKEGDLMQQITLFMLGAHKIKKL